MNSKKHNGMLLSLLTWCIGILLLVVQNVLEPMTLNNIARALQTTENTTIQTIVLLLILFLGATVGATVLSAINGVLRETLMTAFSTRHCIELLKKVLYTHNQYLVDNEPEKVVGRITRDTETVSSLRMSVLMDIPMIVIGLAVTAYMMFCGSFPVLEIMGFSPQRGNVLLASVIVSLVPFHLIFMLFGKKLSNIEQSQADAAEEVSLITTESLRSIQDTRSAGCFSFVMARLTDALSKFGRSRVRMFAICSVFQNVRSVVWGGSQVIVLSVAAYLIFHKETGFDYADYVGFSVLCGMFNSLVVQGVEVLIEWQRAQQALNRLSDIESLPDTYGNHEGDKSSLKAGDLEFNNVTFDVGKIRILQGASLVIKRGWHVAVVGPSGSGKSTLLKMAARHLTPSGGKVVYADTDVEDLSFQELVGEMAYVSQNPFVFKGTILDNILVGRDLPVTREDVLQLLEDVALSEDLKRIGGATDVLSIRIGSDGKSLSGGQIAKLALARALIVNPAVLLLDEISAALDEISQDRIMKMLASKQRDKTIVFISHRLQSVRNLDQIFVMDSGRVVQRGTYDELARETGLFVALLSGECGAQLVDSSYGLPFDETSRGVVQTLSLSPILSVLDGAILFKLASKAMVVRQKQGDLVFRKGDCGDSLYIIKSGEVSIVGHRLGPGMSFGEIAMFGQGMRTADVTCVKPSTFVALPREALLDLVSSNPPVLLKLLEAMARIVEREAFVEGRKGSEL